MISIAIEYCEGFLWILKGKPLNVIFWECVWGGEEELSTINFVFVIGHQLSGINLLHIMCISQLEYLILNQLTCKYLFPFQVYIYHIQLLVCPARSIPLLSNCTEFYMQGE